MPVSLESLDVSFNEFTGGIPSEWDSLTNLKELKVVVCGLDGASRAIFPHIPRHTSQSHRDFPTRAQGRYRSSSCAGSVSKGAPSSWLATLASSFRPTSASWVTA